MSRENLIADAIIRAAEMLGLNNALTPMGALELIAHEIRGGTGEIAMSLDSVADGLLQLAEAIRETK
jgi:hypothetical protein